MSNIAWPAGADEAAADVLRAHGVTQREIDLMYKINPAKLLSLPPPEDTATATTLARP